MEDKSENIIILDFFSLFRQNLLQNVMKNQKLVTLVHLAIFWLSHLWPATNNFQENSGTYMYPLVCLVLGAILLNHQIFKSAKTKVVCKDILHKISLSWQDRFFLKLPTCPANLMTWLETSL